MQSPQAPPWGDHVQILSMVLSADKYHLWLRTERTGLLGFAPGLQQHPKGFHRKHGTEEALPGAAFVLFWRKLPSHAVSGPGKQALSPLQAFWGDKRGSSLSVRLWVSPEIRRPLTFGSEQGIQAEPDQQQNKNSQYNQIDSKSPCPAQRCQTCCRSVVFGNGQPRKQHNG